LIACFNADDWLGRAIISTALNNVIISDQLLLGWREVFHEG
jgi:hypothetical protein